MHEREKRSAPRPHVAAAHDSTAVAQLLSSGPPPRRRASGCPRLRHLSPRRPPRQELPSSAAVQYLIEDATDGVRRGLWKGEVQRGRESSIQTACGQEQSEWHSLSQLDGNFAHRRRVKLLYVTCPKSDKKKITQVRSFDDCLCSNKAPSHDHLLSIELRRA